MKNEINKLVMIIATLAAMRELANAMPKLLNTIPFEEFESELLYEYYKINQLITDTLESPYEN